VENGVPLAKCDHVNGEKSSCQDFLSFLRSLSLSLSLPPFSLSFSISIPKGGWQKSFSGRVSRVHPCERRWLRKGLASRGTTKDRRVRERERERDRIHPSIGIKRVTSPWGEIESERAGDATRRDALLLRGGPKKGRNVRGGHPVTTPGHVDFFIVTWLLLAARLSLLR